MRTFIQLSTSGNPVLEPKSAVWFRGKNLCFDIEVDSKTVSIEVPIDDVDCIYVK